MTKKTKPAAPGAVTYDSDRLAVLTHTLVAPVEHEGERIGTITLTEPRAYDSIKVEAKGVEGAKRLEALIWAISDLPDGVHLKARDLGRIVKWLGGLTSDALALDGIIAAETEVDPFDLEPGAGAASGMDEAEIDALEDERTFNLLVPFEFEGRRVERLTATEPTLDAMLAGQKYKEPSRQTAAMVAAVTGQPLPVINRLALRDLNRVEAWLGPFVRGLVSA